MKAQLSLIDRTTPQNTFRIKVVTIPSTMSPKEYFDDFLTKSNLLEECNPIMLKHDNGIIFKVGKHFEFDTSNTAIQHFFKRFFELSNASDLTANKKVIELTPFADTYPEVQELAYINAYVDVERFCDFGLSIGEGVIYQPNDGFKFNDLKGDKFLKASDVAFLNCINQRCKDIVGQEKYVEIFDEKITKTSNTIKNKVVADPFMLEQLKAYYKAIIEAYDSDSDLLVTKFSEKYPFKISFDELNIIEWVDSLIGETYSPDMKKFIDKNINGNMSKLLNRFSELLNKLDAKDLGILQTTDKYPFNLPLNVIAKKVSIWAINFAVKYDTNIITKASYEDLIGIEKILSIETTTKLLANKNDNTSMHEITEILVGFIKSKFNLNKEDALVCFKNDADYYYQTLRDISVQTNRNVVKYKDFSASEKDINLLKPNVENLEFDNSIEILNGYFKRQYDETFVDSNKTNYDNFLTAVFKYINGEVSDNIDDVDEKFVNPKYDGYNGIEIDLSYSQWVKLIEELYNKKPKNTEDLLEFTELWLQKYDLAYGDEVLENGDTLIEMLSEELAEIGFDIEAEEKEVDERSIVDDTEDSPFLVELLAKVPKEFKDAIFHSHYLEYDDEIKGKIRDWMIKEIGDDPIVDENLNAFMNYIFINNI